MGVFSADPIPLEILPGIFKEESEVGAGARWYDGNLIRFKNGLPQSLGGWERAPLSAPILGLPRSIHDWVALDGTQYIAVGTEKRLYIIQEDLTVTNITPIRDSGELTDPFTTSAAGAFDPSGASDPSYFQVTHNNHGVSEGDMVTFTSSSTVGGITITGDYQVVSVVDTNNYILKADSPASSTVAGEGGSVDYIYEVNVGHGTTGVRSGFGTGGFGRGTYGTPRLNSTFVVQLRTWSLDNWGEDLIASPRGGKIYVWDKSDGVGERAKEIDGAPETNLRVIVSEQNRQLISFGAHTGLSNDPLFIAWTDTEDYTTWIPSTGNNAGNKRIDEGSEIVTAVQTRTGILVFTDTGLHVMQPVASDEVFGVRSVGTGISIAGPSAAVDANGIVYFMGMTNFYLFDGVLRVLPCAVWEHVFTDLNKEQAFSVFCSHNKDFNEIWWFYPGQGEVTNNKYVVYNYVENVWYPGELQRASFHDFSPFFNRPYAFDNAGNLYIHEKGEDADDEPMQSYIESGYFTFPRVMQVQKMIPDFKTLSGSARLILKGKKRPQSKDEETVVKGPYDITAGTEEVGARIRARHIALRIEQSGLGSNFRMGTWRAEMVPDGER